MCDKFNVFTSFQRSASPLNVDINSHFRYGTGHTITLSL